MLCYLVRDKSFISVLSGFSKFEERRTEVEDSQVRTEVYRGHFPECFKHFRTRFAARVPKGSPRALQEKQPIADFCGVKVDSLTRWLNTGKRLPVGEQHIKLMCYLDLIGYRVLELENMSTTIRNFAELIGYGIFSGPQAAKLLGYSAPTSLYTVLDGVYGISQDKKNKMWEMWKEKKTELNLRKEDLQKILAPDVWTAKSPDRSTPAAEAKPMKRSLRQAALIAVMDDLLLLLREEVTEDDLSSLQPSAGVILKLTARLNEISAQLIQKGAGNGR